MDSSASQPAPTPTDPTVPVLNYLAQPQNLVPSDWRNIEVFTLRPETKQNYLILVVTILAITYFLMFLILLMVVILGLKLDIPVVYLGICCGLFCFLKFAITAFRRVRKILSTWNQYHLTFADEGFMQYSTPHKTHRILRSEVHRITEQYESFRLDLITGSHILIPKRITDLPQVRKRLAAWQPLQVKKGISNLLVLLTQVIGLPILSLLVFGWGMLSEDTAPIVFCAVLVWLLAVLILHHTWRNLNIPLSLKIKSSLILLQPLILTLRLILHLLYS